MKELFLGQNEYASKDRRPTPACIFGVPSSSMTTAKFKPDKHAELDSLWKHLETDSALFDTAAQAVNPYVCERDSSGRLLASQSCPTLTDPATVLTTPWTDAAVWNLDALAKFRAEPWTRRMLEFKWLTPDEALPVWFLHGPHLWNHEVFVRVLYHIPRDTPRLEDPEDRAQFQEMMSQIQPRTYAEHRLMLAMSEIYEHSQSGTSTPFFYPYEPYEAHARPLRAYTALAMYLDPTKVQLRTSLPPPPLDEQDLACAFSLVD